MMENLLIRKINKNDAVELFNMMNDTDKKIKNFFHPHEFDEGTIKNICESENDHYYVMIKNKKIIGYSFLRLFGYEIPSFGIFIKKEFTRKGYGTYLTKWTIEKARNIGYQKVILKTYKKNIHAQKVYEKIGFKIIGETDDKKQYKMELKLR
jgi:RimJ/RimL family protein N-acetyltransferase